MVLMSDNAAVVDCGTQKETGSHGFSRDVQSGTGDSHLGRAVRDLSLWTVHSREEERSHLPAQLFLGYSVPSAGSTGVLSSFSLP